MRIRMKKELVSKYPKRPAKVADRKKTSASELEAVLASEKGRGAKA